MLAFISLFLASALDRPSETGLLSQEALDTVRGIAEAVPSTKPSLQALTTHLSDLEQEVRDSDFRLQFMYNQRLATLALLKTVRDRIETLET